MISLYVHIPYCLRKCAYCDFHSVAVEGGVVPHEGYLQMLLRQLDREVGRLGLAGRAVETVYFGGGTPSLMPPAFFAAMIEAVAKPFTLAADAEISCEVNPATADAAWFREARRCGITRISLGVQSFQPELLGLLGRIHTSEEAMRAIAEAQDAGFASVSCDLIYAIPGESTPQLEEDLRTALTFQPHHLSAYALSIEEGTPLAARAASGEIAPLDDDAMLQQLRLTARMLGRAGRPRYEISSFAQPGFECRHNLNYWRYGEYLGLGSGATSFLRNASHESRTTNHEFAHRWTQTRDLEAFLGGSEELDAEETLDAVTAMGEFCFLGLRTSGGIGRKDFQAIFQVPFDDLFAEGVAELVSEGSLTDDGERLRLTERGIEISNRVFTRFLP